MGRLIWERRPTWYAGAVVPSTATCELLPMLATRAINARDTAKKQIDRKSEREGGREEDNRKGARGE